MAGSITLPQVVLDLEEEDRKQYEALKAPTSIVIRYGYMRMVAELPYDGEAKPGCGSKLVVRTRRGIEVGEMLTTTCGNGGCGKSVSRKQMLDYIDNSGGRDYPFTNQGKVLRVATVEDLNEQGRLDAQKPAMIRFTRDLIIELNLPMKLVDIELLLGGERILFHYAAEDWIDFRELVRRLASEYQTRIEMHQVNARDEARITADYEKCGQHCCCKQFLKVLKPVSMRSAKVQKATLDPTKISGRCGRLMCCLRYEDETYETLRKKLPNRQSRMMTPDGPGTVLDTQILTQLVLIIVDGAQASAAYPLENIQMLTREEDAAIRAKQPPLPAVPPRDERRRDDRPPRGDGRPEGREQRDQRNNRENRDPQREPRRPQPGAPLRDNEVEAREGSPAVPAPRAVQPPMMPPPEAVDGDVGAEESDGPEVEGDQNAANDSGGGQGYAGAPPAQGDGQPPQGDGQRRRRRCRRRRGRGGQGPGGGGPSQG